MLLNRLYIPVVRNGKASLIKNPEAKKSRDLIYYESVRQKVNKKLEGDLSMKIDFCYTGKRNKDIDGLLKLLFDSLNGVCYHDDEQITELIIRKHRAQTEDEVIISLEKIKE
jgi:Holliday junction resolvase RusA-like endonuclease